MEFNINQLRNLILFLILISYNDNHALAQGKYYPQWGEKNTRNMISEETDLPSTFNPETGENIKWEVSIGSHGYATPIVSQGRVFIGANNRVGLEKPW